MATSYIFLNSCDRDPPTGNFKNSKFFQNSLKILDVRFWGNKVYLFVAGEVLGLCGSGGPVGGSGERLFGSGAGKNMPKQACTLWQPFMFVNRLESLG